MTIRRRLLKAEGLQIFETQKPASFELLGGERVVLQGESGCGKSTLLRTLAGLRHARLGSVDAPHRPAIAYLAQKPHFLPGTALANLRVPFDFMVNAGLVFSRERILAWLEEIGFTETLLSREAKSLSGGEGQVIHLLRALQLDPSVLLLDEATSALDQNRVEKVESLLRRWMSEGSNRALIFVSHDPGLAERFATRVWRMSARGLDV